MTPMQHLLLKLFTMTPHQIQMSQVHVYIYCLLVTKPDLRFVYIIVHRAGHGGVNGHSC